MLISSKFTTYVDGLIRSGQASKARTELSRYRLEDASRDARFEIAAAARRAGLPYLTLKLLSPVVIPAPKRPARATNREKAEYAAALVRVGAAREALGILATLNPQNVPQVLLYRVLALFTQWDYESSIPLLRQYLEMPIDDYQKVIAKVNLASAFVHERQYGEAQKLLGELETLTLRGGLTTLYGNTLERLAELAIYQGDWVRAETHLGKAERAVQEAGGMDIFFVRKWRNILALFRNPKSALPALSKFRTESIEKKHWETVRECDAYRAVVCQDEQLFLRVYFGTPFASYRKRLVADYGTPLSIPETYAWALGEREPSKICRLLEMDSVKFGQQKHRLMRVLSSDFYRPFRVVHLFSQTYPGDHFDIRSSRARIHQGIAELRLWLKARRVPIGVVESGGEYRLAPVKNSIALQVYSPQWWEKNGSKGLGQIRKNAGSDYFSVAEVATWLKIPRRTAFELVKEALDRKIVDSHGAGPATRYRIKSAA